MGIAMVAYRLENAIKLTKLQDLDATMLPVLPVDQLLLIIHRAHHYQGLHKQMFLFGYLPLKLVQDRKQRHPVRCGYVLGKIGAEIRRDRGEIMKFL